MSLEWFDGLDAAWAWLAIGLALAALELVVPGVYLIWLAMAAIVVGALTAALDLGTTLQVVGFAFLSLGIVYAAKRFLRDRPIESSDPLLNNRGGRMIGESAIVVQAIEGGEGRVKYGDSEWIARGDDCAVGQRVRITDVKGTALSVEIAVSEEPVAIAETPAAEA